MKLASFCIGFFATLASTAAAAQTVRYVDSAAKQGGNGLSWESALPTIYEAVNSAEPGDEIWVRQGLYKVDEGTIDLGTDLVLRGGFLGDETDISQRDIGAHPTLITADLLGNDTADFASRNDNTQVTMIAGGALLDGLVIRGAAYQAIDNAGGMQDCIVEDCLLLAGDVSVVYFESIGEERINIKRCVFQECARESGDIREGVLEIRATSLSPSTLVQDCDFLNNGLLGDGTATGLVVNALGVAKTNLSEFTIQRCHFQGNVSKTRYPGAMWGAFYDYRIADVIDCRFEQNTTFGSSASVELLIAEGSEFTMSDSEFIRNSSQQARAGAIHLRIGSSLSSRECVVERCTFEQNSGEDAGALSVDHSGFEDSLLIRDCEFVRNSSESAAAAEIWAGGSGFSVEIRDTLFDANYSINPNVYDNSVLFAEDTVLIGCEFRNHTSVAAAFRSEGGLRAFSTILQDNSFTRIASESGVSLTHSVVWNSSKADFGTAFTEGCALLNCVLDETPEASQFTAEHCVFPGAEPGLTNLDLDLVGPVFVDADNGDFRPIPGSALIDAGSLKWSHPELIEYTLDLSDLDRDGVKQEFLPIDIEGTARNQDDPNTPGAGPDIGLYELGDALPDTSPCLPDMDRNGYLDPSDFYGWKSAYTHGYPRADQNGDGFITPTDFTAWITNYNRGCY